LPKYVLDYELRVVTPGHENEIGKATFRLSECNGALELSYRFADGNISMFSDGKTSLMTQDVGTNMYLDGLALGASIIPVYMPFNYACQRTFGTMDEFKQALPEGTLPKLAPLLGDSNISILIGDHAGIPLFGNPGRLERSKVGKGEFMTLRVGRPKAQTAEYIYSDFADLKSMKVPKNIVLKIFKPAQNPETGPSLVQTYNFNLVNMSSEPKDQDIPDINHLLKSGMVVSCFLGEDRCTVIYDPKSGPFEQQVKLQQGNSKLRPKVKEEPSRFGFWIPMVLAVVSGIVAVVLVFRRKPAKM
jgi:hypothetical protein